MNIINTKSLTAIYLLVWGTMVAVYNTIVFVIPEEINGVSRFTTMFWVGYALMMVMFIVQAVVSFLAFRKISPNKNLLFRLPLLKTSIVTTLAMFPISVLFMIFPNSPTWVGVVLIAIIVAVTVVVYARAMVLPAVVEGVEKTVKVKSVFIRSLTADAEALLNSSDDEAINQKIEQVYETIRYSDPLSVDEVAVLETNITEAFIVFRDAAEKKLVDEIDKDAKVLINLLNQRNAKVKLLK